MARDSLLAHYGHRDVILASSESYSHSKTVTSLEDYVSRVMERPQNPNSPANESWYLFGDTLGKEWAPLVADYPLPMDAASDSGICAWGCGTRFSGVSFHTHGAAFAETLHGRKRWWLAPPRGKPDFSPIRSQFQWALEHDLVASEVEPASETQSKSNQSHVDSEFQTLDLGTTPSGTHSGPSPTPSGIHSGLSGPESLNAMLLLACTASPGHVIYIPPQWWHATLNLDDWTSFISTFTMEKWTWAF